MPISKILPPFSARFFDRGDHLLQFNRLSQPPTQDPFARSRALPPRRANPSFHTPCKSSRPQHHLLPQLLPRPQRQPFAHLLLHVPSIFPGPLPFHSPSQLQQLRYSQPIIPLPIQARASP